jgi:hypothetical protein
MLLKTNGEKTNENGLSTISLKIQDLEATLHYIIEK